MSVPKLLEEAASRLEDASARIEAAQGKPLDEQNTREWLEALSDYVRALAELHEYTNESIHEKLHTLFGRMGMRQPPPSPSP